MTLSVGRVASLQGEFRPPSDKSITHRAYMLAAIADEPSLIRRPLRGEDCEATLRCLAQLGTQFDWMTDEDVRIIPPSEWMQPSQDLYCGNSGTTMRLLSGLIASRPLRCTLTGDESLSKRPMKRIAEPLRQMGAEVEGDTAPIHIRGGQLKGIRYHTPVPSAQIKSCVLLAGLRADGETTVIEDAASRDHTERMLDALGVPISYNFPEHGVTVKGGLVPSALELTVPGDISSAAFFLVAAALIPGSEVIARNVGVNPTRAGLYDVLLQCEADARSQFEGLEVGEPMASLAVKFKAGLKPFEIDGGLVPRLIDEIPVLAVLATQCEGVTKIRGAKELRVKESDRIEAVAGGLRAMGAKVEVFEDGMEIEGPTPLKATTIHANGDHRIAMAFAVAGMIAEGTTKIEGAETIKTSYPDFESEMWRMIVV
jgi:3-phosphoshikimate 1-carboxyvinyltransferase